MYAFLKRFNARSLELQFQVFLPKVIDLTSSKIFDPETNVCPSKLQKQNLPVRFLTPFCVVTSQVTHHVSLAILGTCSLPTHKYLNSLHQMRRTVVPKHHTSKQNSLFGNICFLIVTLFTILKIKKRRQNGGMRCAQQLHH